MKLSRRRMLAATAGGIATVAARTRVGNFSSLAIREWFGLCPVESRQVHDGDAGAGNGHFHRFLHNPAVRPVFLAPHFCHVDFLDKPSDSKPIVKA